MTRLDRRNAAQLGLTLVELLVSIAIISVMMVIGLGLTGAATRAYAAAERRQAILDLVAASQFLKSQIEGAAPVVAGFDSGRPIIYFEGGAHALEFVSAEPAQAELPVLQSTRIYLDGENLVLARAPLSNKGRSERRILASGVTDLRLGYAGVRGGGELASEWSGRSEFPALVVIEADTAPGLPKWRALSAEPRVATSW